jgi:hypothetical protein
MEYNFVILYIYDGIVKNLDSDSSSVAVVHNFTALGPGVRYWDSESKGQAPTASALCLMIDRKSGRLAATRGPQTDQADTEKGDR